MRSLLAGLALMLSFLTGSAALAGYVAHQVFLDPDRVGTLVDAALQQPDLRARILAEVVPGFSQLPAATRSEIDSLARTPLAGQVTERLSVTPGGRVVLTPLARELASGLRANGRPDLARAVTDAARDTSVRVPASAWDRFDTARDLSWRVATQGGALTGLLLAAAVLVSRRRGRTVAGVGLVALACCLLVGAAVWLLPELVRTLASGTAAEVAAGVVAGQQRAALLSLAPVAVGGMLLLVLGLAAAAASPRRSGYQY